MSPFLSTITMTNSPQVCNDGSQGQVLKFQKASKIVYLCKMTTSNCLGIKLHQLPLATLFQTKQKFQRSLMNIHGKVNELLRSRAFWLQHLLTLWFLANHLISLRPISSSVRGEWSSLHRICVKTYISMVCKVGNRVLIT